MTFKQFMKGIKAIPWSAWKKILVPTVCVFVVPVVGLIITGLNFKKALMGTGIIVGPIVLNLYVLRWISDFLSSD